MKRKIHVLMAVALCSVATFSAQDPSQLDSRARERIEQSRASIVVLKRMDQSNETISQAVGFFIRKDLVATDSEIVDPNSHLRLTAATPERAIKVLSSGNYVLPYVLVETQAEVSPLSLADSDHVALNDRIYMLSDSGKIVAGTVTGTTTIKNTRAFLISLPIDSKDKGAPVFNRDGEVIGIAAKSPEGQSAGLVWPSQLLATLKHLGEPGVGAGSGDGPRYSVRPTTPDPDRPATPAVDTKPVRLSAPNPRYTEAARANGTQGSVTLRVLVGVDGNVKAIRVVRGLPDGLTEQAIAAARESKFRPALKDGNPVEFWIALEMTFTIR
jgi:TonB family protein